MTSNLLSLNAYHYHRGGADNVYLGHAKLFQENGWNIYYYSMHHDKNIPCEESQWFAEEINYEKNVSFSKRVSHASRIIYSLEAQRKLRELLKFRKVDIAHAHSVYHHQSPSVLVELKRHGIPIVMTAHDLKLACPSYTMLNETGICEKCKGGKVWNVVRHRCIKGSLAASAVIAVESAIHKSMDIYNRHVDRIVTPSAFYRAKLIEWGWNPDKIVHIPNFVDAPIVQRPAETVLDYILYFGRLSHEKGLKTLIRAAATTGIKVMIAGGGPQEEELRALAQELAAPVEFAGFRRGNDLWKIVDQARAVVLPSEWYENGPMSAIEALARGKALIGSRIGGIPELIEEGKTGWAFEAGNVIDLCRAMQAARDTSADGLAFMADCARESVSGKYSREEYYRKMLHLYQELL